jgi:small GTP-binding protein
MTARPIVAIVGRPNVGKSRLFNRLLKRSRSIVLDEPGVTRDRIYADAVLNGEDGDHEVVLVDTGGFDPSSSDPIMRRVLEQTQLAIDEADVVIHLTDGRAGLIAEDHDIARLLRKSGKKVVLTVNKVDGAKQDQLLNDFYELGLEHTLPVSAAHGRNVNALEEVVCSLLPLREDEPSAIEEAPTSLEEPSESKAPLRVAVIGRPNSGKSSLINRLLGEDRHLVSEVAGTTVDTIDSLIEWKGEKFLFIDTAGIRRKRSIAMRIERFSVVAALKGRESLRVRVRAWKSGAARRVEVGSQTSRHAEVRLREDVAPRAPAPLLCADHLHLGAHGPRDRRADARDREGARRILSSRRHGRAQPLRRRCHRANAAAVETVEARSHLLHHPDRNSAAALLGVGQRSGADPFFVSALLGERAAQTLRLQRIAGARRLSIAQEGEEARRSVAEEEASARVNELLESYASHGFARLGPVLDEATLAVLRARADEMMLGRLTYPGLFFQLGLEVGKGWQGPSLDYRKMEKLELDPEFRKVVEHPRFEPIVRSLVQGSGISLYRAVLFNKAASGGTLLPWHQDGGKMWGIDRDPGMQIWVALDDAPIEAGCLEIIPGSHKDGLATPLGGVVPESIVEERSADARREYLPARAGEALLLHNYLWHRSGMTTTGRARRALSICYLSAETKCVRKRHAPREFLRLFLRERDHALDHDLIAG